MEVWRLFRSFILPIIKSSSLGAKKSRTRRIAYRLFLTWYHLRSTAELFYPFVREEKAVDSFRRRAAWGNRKKNSRKGCTIACLKYDDTCLLRVEGSILIWAVSPMNSDTVIFNGYELVEVLQNELLYRCQAVFS